jgi:hypothetical protein
MFMPEMCELAILANSQRESGSQNQNRRQLKIPMCAGILAVQGTIFCLCDGSFPPASQGRERPRLHLFRSLKHDQADATQAPPAQNPDSVRRPARIDELSGRIRQLANARAVLVHHEDLESVLQVAREDNPVAIG